MGGALTGWCLVDRWMVNKWMDGMGWMDGT